MLWAQHPLDPGPSVEEEARLHGLLRSRPTQHGVYSELCHWPLPGRQRTLKGQAPVSLPAAHLHTQQAPAQPLTPEPRSSPSSSSSPSLPVSKLGEGVWVPSGSSSRVELTMETQRTGP